MLSKVFCTASTAGSILHYNCLLTCQSPQLTLQIFMDEPVFCVCVYLKDLHSSGLTLAFNGYLVNEYVFKYITLEFHHGARI